jgi:hypothetical protein
MSRIDDNQSWRRIPQGVRRKALTADGRRRLLVASLKLAGTFALVVLTAAGSIIAVRHYDAGREKIAPVVRALPLREVVLITDGPLTDHWLQSRLQLPAEIGLMEIDMRELRARIESHGQVRSAVITRNFPDSLIVTLQERTPVARLMADLGGRPEMLMVSREGAVYQGYGYDSLMVSNLPFLDGIRLARAEQGGFQPLEGIERLADLLMLAQQEAPHLYRSWRVVSLKERPRLIVRSREIAEIVFEPDNFRRQLARLDYIVDHFRSEGSGAIDRVDLSLGNQVAVEVDRKNPSAGRTINQIGRRN